MTSKRNYDEFEYNGEIFSSYKDLNRLLKGNIDEQLKIIEEFGKSKNLNVLRFLEYIFISEDTGRKIGGSNDFGDEFDVKYINATGVLREVLDYYRYGLSSEPTTYEEKSSPYHCKTYSVISTAINQLDKEIK